jgi:hypothetical protein
MKMVLPVRRGCRSDADIEQYPLFFNYDVENSLFAKKANGKGVKNDTSKKSG